MAVVSDPHAGQPVLRSGPSPKEARLVAILLHGRGASAHDILGLTQQFSATDVAYVAPQAAASTWYPHSFLAPIQQNEPWLSSALRMVAGLVDQFGQQGIPPQQLVVMGFSQGACLTLGLIGPPGTPRKYAGDFASTPIFIGSSDIDPHVPLERVRESSVVLRRMSANVDERIYPRMGHTINTDEIEAEDALLANKA